ncbi:hypothetical protein [Novosphingobium sp. JCM 18896]|nr:hypothetical protein [Novosphingobium sp. JCM 18896]MCW1430423.1 hypothetical protein [Novosphingobium sp. JCM 18896]
MNQVDRNPDPEAERMRIIRGRNRVFGVLLIGFAVLIFAISIAKMA